MKKLLALLVTVVLTVLVLWQLGWLKSPQDIKQTELVEDIAEVLHIQTAPKLTQYIPADTVLYLGGSSSSSIYEFLADYPLFKLSASDRVVIHELKRDLLAAETEEAQFLDYLINDYSEHVDGTLSQFMSHYGLAATGEYAMYLHGLIPVMNVPVADAEKLISIFVQASESAALGYEQTRIGEADVMSWQFKQAPFKLLLATTKQSAILTFALPQDSDAILMERLAQTPVTNPITETVQNISQQYQYSQDMVAMFDIEQLVRGLFLVGDTSLGRDISRYIAAEDYATMLGDKALVQQCKADIVELVSSAPRMVSGYTKLDIQTKVLTADTHGIWELKSDLVKQALMKMQGTLASHTTQIDDQLFSMGMALNVAELAPAVTSLWQAFTEAPFTCEALKQAQDQARQVSPMMLGMFTGMAQGLKGAGLTVYDISLDEASETPVTLDAALTVEADHPANLLTLLRLFPEFAEVNIPDDGTIVPLNLSLPLGLTLKGTIQGQHLVIFNGDRSQALAKGIANEPLLINALGSGGVLNYKRLADMAMRNQLMGMAESSSEACIEGYSILDNMQSMDVDLSFYTYATDNGLAVKMKSIMPKTTKPHGDAVLTGEWQAEYLDDQCQWLPLGKETLNADGKGRYEEMDESGNCQIYASQYKWARKGDQIVMTDTVPSRSRGHCEAEWETDETPTTYYCELMHIQPDSFMCLYHNEDNDPFLYRYTR
jgi:hypothetical protein